MTRYADQTPEHRALADRLYAEHNGRLWVGPCGHPASSMWTTDDLVIHCSVPIEEHHRPSPLHFLGHCSAPDSGCTVVTCPRTYTADDLP